MSDQFDRRRFVGVAVAMLSHAPEGSRIMHDAKNRDDHRGNSECNSPKASNRGKYEMENADAYLDTLVQCFQLNMLLLRPQYQICRYIDKDRLVSGLQWSNRPFPHHGIKRRYRLFLGALRVSLKIDSSAKPCL